MNVPSPRKYLLLEFEPYDVEHYGIEKNEYGKIYYEENLMFDYHSQEKYILRKFIHEIDGDIICYYSDDYTENDFLYEYFGCEKVIETFRNQNNRISLNDKKYEKYYLIATQRNLK